VAGGLDRWQSLGLPVERPAQVAPEHAERFARHLVLPQVGPKGQARLQSARVLLAGLGGLNSPAALYLAAAGVGTLGLVDFDQVERSNLQRQVLYGDEDVGHQKAAAARRRLQRINPELRCEVVDERINSGNAEWLVSGWDVVVDGTDNLRARHALNAACVKAGVPLVFGAVARFQGQVSVFWPASEPGKAPCLNCLIPENGMERDPPSCAEAGVLGVVPGIVGTLQAAETLKILLRTGEALVGSLLVIDALAMDFRRMKVRPDPACPVCG
jgi:molybdopterin/thiamine biosynthesis adenylyltransferase